MHAPSDNILIVLCATRHRELKQTMTLSNNQQKAIAIWLFICCATIFAMVVLGGVTRLTGSGLSMVEWEPLMGILPPLSHSEWQQTFQLYQQFPEYKINNYSMNLEEFKSIFWFEYSHRLLGRAIGLIFIIPLLYFIITRQVRKSLIPKLLGMFILGGLQGLMGWYMVKSGLVQDPHVSQYRLTAHLALAFIVYAYIFWVALDLFFSRQNRHSKTVPGNLKRFSLLLTLLIFITVLSGGFVAGLKAGYVFNTFPLMAGRLIPESIFALSPIWKNFFENMATVQFDHRLMATMLFIIIPLFWLTATRQDISPRARVGLHLLLAMLAIQLGLGISTLLLHVPVPLAVAHQAGALILFTIMLFVTHELWRSPD